MKYPASTDPRLKKMIKELVKSHTEPFYLYDEAVIIRNKQGVDACFSWQDGYMNYFPVRENSNPFLLSVLWSAGSGVLACGAAELLLCKKLGFQGDRVLFQPDIQDAEGAAIAEEIDAAWLVTSPTFLPARPCKTVLLRYCPDERDRSAVSVHAKTGLTKPELLDTLRILKIRNTPQIGLEIQMKPFDYSPHAYYNKAKALYCLLQEFASDTDLKISFCNLGDMVRQVDRAEPEHNKLRKEAEAIRSLWENLPVTQKPVIQTTLSRHVMESAGILVSRVLEIRHLYQKQLVLNVSFCQFLRPALFRARKDVSIVPMTRKQGQTPQLYNIVGPVPEEFDRLVPERVLLSASVGDLCIIHDVGCGARSMPMLYHFQPLCAEFVIDINGNVQRIAKERTSGEVMNFMLGYDAL